MRLQSKVTLFFVCFFILLMLQWFFFLTYEHQIFFSEAEDKGRLVTENLAEMSREPIANYQFSRLIEQIDSISRKADIDHISIVNERNLVLADTRERIEGWIFSGPLASSTEVSFTQETMLVRSPVIVSEQVIGNVEIAFSLDAFMSKIRRSTMIFLLFLAGEISIAVLFGFFTEMQLVKPLDQLTEKVSSIAEVSEAQRVQIPASSLIEIERVSQAIDQMERDLKHAEKELIAKTKLATLGKIAANFSHEIRNPLEAMSGSVEILGYHIPEGSEEHEYLMIIREEIENLNDYLENFLQFSGPQKLQKSHIDIAKLIESTVLLLRPLFQKASVDLEVTAAPEMPLCPADRGQIKRVLINTLINSIEAFGEQSGTRRISIDTDTHRSDLRIRITDTGEGIDEERIEHVFDPYFSTKPEGTGIGLAICRTIIERHEGSIHIARTSAGGTELSIRLPLAAREETGS